MKAKKKKGMKFKPSALPSTTIFKKGSSNVSWLQLYLYFFHVCQKCFVYALLSVHHLFIQDDLTLLSTTAGSDIVEQFPLPTQEIEEEPMEVEGGAKHITSVGDFKEVSAKNRSA